MRGDVAAGNLDPKKNSREGAAAASPRCHLRPPFPSEGSQELNTNGLKIQLPLFNLSALNADQFLFQCLLAPQWTCESSGSSRELLPLPWSSLPLRPQGSLHPASRVPHLTQAAELVSLLEIMNLKGTFPLVLPKPHQNELNADLLFAATHEPGTQRRCVSRRSPALNMKAAPSEVFWWGGEYSSPKKTKHRAADITFSLPGAEQAPADGVKDGASPKPGGWGGDTQHWVLCSNETQS